MIYNRQDKAAKATIKAPSKHSKPTMVNSIMSEVIVCMLFVFYMLKNILEFLKTNDVIVLDIIDRYMATHKQRKQHNRMDVIDNNYIRHEYRNIRY